MKAQSSCGLIYLAVLLIPAIANSMLVKGKSLTSQSFFNPVNKVVINTLLPADPDVSITDGLNNICGETFNVANVDINNQGAIYTVLIKDEIGAGILHLTNWPLEISGVNADQFQIVTQPLSSVSPGHQTELRFRFAPTSFGQKSATITIACDDPDEGSCTFTLSAFCPEPDVFITNCCSTSICGGTINMNNVDINHLGSSKIVYIINAEGAGLLHITNLPIEISGTDANQFQITTQPPPNIPGGSSYSLGVRFAPTSYGQKTATITIESNDPDEGSCTFNLSANCPEPDISATYNNVNVCNNQLNFGVVNIGSSKNATVLIKNVPGAGTLHIDIPLEVLGSGEFSITTTQPSSTILAGTSTNLGIIFSPTYSGIHTGIIVISSDDPDNPICTINLLGCNGITWYLDDDEDGYGLTNVPAGNGCVSPGPKYSTTPGDCDDQNADRHPNLSEFCDGVDNDCDEAIDDGLAFNEYYHDNDHDNYGNSTSTGPRCDNPGYGYSLQTGDCNDSNPNINPGEDEICNGIDDNCNGPIDENCCTTPSSPVTANITPTSSQLNWDAVESATKYKLEWKPSTASSWTTIKVNAPVTSTTLTGLTANTKYKWKVKSVCGSGTNSAFSSVIKFTSAMRTGDLLPQKRGISVYPNPFITSGSVSFSLEQDAFVSLEILDLSGRKTNMVNEGHMEAGDHTLPLNCNSLPAGIYFLRVIMNDETSILKIVIQ